MPDQSAPTLDQESEATRKRRKKGAYDLERTTEKVLSQPNPIDVHEENERAMREIADPYVRLRLKASIKQVKDDYKDVLEPSELIHKVAYLKTTLVPSGIIDTFRIQLESLGLRSHYSQEVIRDYIVREFNKNRKKYGIVAIVDHNDVVLVHSLPINRAAMAQLFDDL